MDSAPGPIPRSWPTTYPLHRPILTSEFRALEASASQAFGIPDLLLMERAAWSVACLARWLPSSPSAPLLVLCGPGNNGGDGYGAARVLASWGRPVRVLDLAPRPASGEATRLERDLCGRVLKVEVLHGDLRSLGAALAASAGLIDALFGVGLARPLEGWWRDAIACVNAARLPTLAVDLPSGLDADTGEALPLCVRADLTATLAAPKLGISSGMPGAVHAGHVVEVDIGLPWALHAPYLARA